MSGRKPAGSGGDDDGDPARGVIEAILESQPQILERVEGALGGAVVLGVVPRGEESDSVSVQAIARGD